MEPVEVYHLPCVSLRLFNVYGPRARTSGTYGAVFGVFLAQKLAAKPFTVVGDGTQTRDFTFVGDIVNGLIESGLREAAVGEEFNLASGKETRIIDLANMVNSATGNTAGVRHVSRRSWDTKMRLVASVEKASAIIGYKPNTTFEEGLGLTIEWFKENWDLIHTSARFGPGVSSAVREMTGDIPNS